jgi:hypothetical protein
MIGSLARAPIIQITVIPLNRLFSSEVLCAIAESEEMRDEAEPLDHKHCNADTPVAFQNASEQSA